MSKKLHILFLCGWYPSRVLPTNGDFIQRHAEAVSLKHHVSVLHIVSDENVKKTEYTFFEKNNIKTHIAYVKKTRNLVFKVFLFQRAYKTLISKIEDFDMVHLNSLYPFGIFALHQKLLKKKPFIISEHWTGYLSPQSKKIGFIEKYISKIITKNASYICTVSENLAENMQKLKFKGAYRTIPNVIDNEIFYPIKKKHNRFNILHISNMKDAQKNISGILNVLQELDQKFNDIFVTLVGEGSKKYKEEAISLGINQQKLMFIDQIPQHDLNNFFGEADIFVLFSNTENLPCVILESFAAGTPVISTDVGGISEFFPENFGTLINAKDEEMLYAEIEKVYLNKKRFASAQEMNRYAISNFGKEKICNDFSALYNESLRN